MARLGGLSSETFSSPTAGLGSILRDQKVISGVKSNRASVILGIARPAVKQSVSVSSSPVESFLLDIGVGADDIDDLKEEDIWGLEDPADVTGSGPDYGKNILNLTDDLGEGRTSKQRASQTPEELGRGFGTPRVTTQEFLVSARRRDKGYGITDVLANNGAIAVSSLLRTSETVRGRIPRLPTATRMIPLSGGAGKDSTRRHAEGQSAPVEVPKWSKITGQGRKSSGFRDEDCLGDKDEDDERLPPHELLAREYARSHQTTFSVCEGLGRTLKGRDLSQVRNAVWSQMGFAD